MNMMKNRYAFDSNKYSTEYTLNILHDIETILVKYISFRIYRKYSTKYTANIVIVRDST